MATPYLIISADLNQTIIMGSRGRRDGREQKGQSATNLPLTGVCRKITESDKLKKSR